MQSCQEGRPLQVPVLKELLSAMGIQIIDYNGASPYAKTVTANKVKQVCEDFQDTVMKCTGTTTQKAAVYSDALMSYASPQTGEAVNIYRAVNYSEGNPLYVIKGLDADGNEFEEMVDASKINQWKITKRWVIGILIWQWISGYRACYSMQRREKYYEHESRWITFTV